MGERRCPPPRGHYLAGEVGRLAGVSGDLIGQWARYGYISSSQSSAQPRVYSYEDVAEALALHELRDRGFSYPTIQVVLASLHERRGYGSWPLSHAPIATTGGTVALVENGTAYDLSGHPWQRLLAEDELQPLALGPGRDGSATGARPDPRHVEGELRPLALDLARGGWAARELPDLRHIEVDPNRLSGRPTIRGRRLRADKVARLAQVPGGRELLRSEYELSEDQIRDAERWWQTTERLGAA
jgi:uncharacterized protein (DUF433 family)/DNA-binding transcriptional MerR regulator